MTRKGLIDIVAELLSSGGAPEDLCGDDAELLAAVKDRLSRYSRITTQLDDLFPTPQTTASATDDLGQESFPEIPGYEITGVLGRGGIGVVYEAKHLRLGRRVAIKMLLSGNFATGRETRRFVREAKTIAALRHPHIVQIFDFGEHEGRPFFTMELLEGGTLGKKLGGKTLTSTEAAAIVATLADAVEAAHRAGIVHRDLKPANVLLTTAGLVKVSDFGIAFQVDDLSITQVGEPIGTPSYMAPEQAAGTIDASSPLVDVYALGTILYETLTGRPPFVGTTAAETRHRVLNEQALSPSNLQAGVARDLDTICSKCLEKDFARRYASAAELSADLRRFLQDEPIKARRISWVGRIARWRRRQPGLAIALFSLLIVISILVIGSLSTTAYFRVLERRQSQLAQDNEVARGVAVTALQSEATLRQQTEEHNVQLRRTLYFSQMNLGGQAASSPSGIGRVVEWIAPWESSAPDLRNWEWYYLNSLCHRDIRTLRGHTAGIARIVRNAKGDRLASAGADGQVIIWNPITGERLSVLKGHTADVVAIAWSGDDRHLASASSDGTTIVWDVRSNAIEKTFAGTRNGVATLAWSPHGDHLASAGCGSAVIVWDIATGAQISSIGNQPQGVRAIAWSPDGTQLASGGPDYDIHLWEVQTGKCDSTFKGHTNFVNDLAWSPDGARIASASNDRVVKIWNAHTGAVLQSLSGHAMGVTQVSWSPDALQLATSSSDQTVRIWSSETGQANGVYRGHTMPTTSVVWLADGKIASASFDGTIKVWPVPAEDEMTELLPTTDGTRAAAWSHDSQWLGATDGEFKISIWNPRTRQRRLVLSGATAELNAVAWSPDDAQLAGASDDGTIRVWDVSNGDVLSTFKVTGSVRSLAWSQDKRLASGGDDKLVHVWDWAHGKEIDQFAGHSASIRAISWSADSARLASGSNDSTLKVWDVAAGKLTYTLTGHTAAITSVAWSSNPHRLATGSEDQTIRIWDPIDNQGVSKLVGHTTTVSAVAWSLDNTRLASSSEDHSIKIWDPATGSVALTLPTEASIPSVVSWNPDGRRIIVAGDRYFLRIYDAAAGYSPTATTRRGAP